MRFEQKASRYHEIAGIQKTVADWCAEWLESDCSKLSGLELGAGTGLFTKHLALRGFGDLCATDISPRMLEEGKARLPFLLWEMQDAWKLESRKVDRIYACSLLQWATSPEKVLRHWRNALCEEGRVLACLFIRGSLEEFSREIKQVSAFPWREESEWTSLFEESGFRILRSETRSDRVSYPSAREALRHIHDIGAVHENRMKPAQLRRILEDSANRAEKNFSLSWRTMRIECERGHR